MPLQEDLVLFLQKAVSQCSTEDKAGQGQATKKWPPPPPQASYQILHPQSHSAHLETFLGSTIQPSAGNLHRTGSRLNSNNQMVIDEPLPVEVAPGSSGAVLMAAGGSSPSSGGHVGRSLRAIERALAGRKVGGGEGRNWRTWGLFGMENSVAHVLVAVNPAVSLIKREWLCYHPAQGAPCPDHSHITLKQVTRAELKGIKEALEQQQAQAIRTVGSEAAEAELMFSNGANAMSGCGRTAGPSLAMLVAANESSGGMSTGSNDQGDTSLGMLTGSGDASEVQRSLLEMVMGRRAMSTLQVR